MAPRRPRFPSKTYGNVHVKGRANVQLGDSQIINNYNVEAAVVSLPDNLVEVLRSAIAQSNATQSHPRESKTSIHSRTPRSVKIDDTAGDGLVTFSSVQEKDVSQSCEKCSKQETELLSKNSSNPVGRDSILEIIQTLCTSLRVKRLLPDLPKLLVHVHRARRQITNGDSASEAFEQQEVTITTQDDVNSRALRDFLMLSVVALSCLLGRNISAKDFAAFLARCKQDQLLPLLTFALGIGIYRLFATQALLSSPIQHFITLEDAYARNIPVSMDILTDFSVLNSFLKAHYRNRQSALGEKLITAGQYHIMIGSRRGMVMGRSNWAAAAQRIKPGFRLINSVYLDSVDAACVGCKSKLVLSVLGDFHCRKCDLFYRDDAALQSQVQASVITSKPFSLADTIERNAGSSSPPSFEPRIEFGRISVDNLSSQPELKKFKHLDLRIVASNENDTAAVRDSVRARKISECWQATLQVEKDIKVAKQLQIQLQERSSGSSYGNEQHAIAKAINHTEDAISNVKTVILSTRGDWAHPPGRQPMWITRDRMRLETAMYRLSITRYSLLDQIQIIRLMVFVTSQRAVDDYSQAPPESLEALPAYIQATVDAFQERQRQRRRQL